jgi:hypothetical protein
MLRQKQEVKGEILNNGNDYFTAPASSRQNAHTTHTHTRKICDIARNTLNYVPVDVALAPISISSPK